MSYSTLEIVSLVILMASTLFVMVCSIYTILRLVKTEKRNYFAIFLCAFCTLYSSGLILSLVLGMTALPVKVTARTETFIFLYTSAAQVWLLVHQYAKSAYFFTAKQVKLTET